MDGREVGLARKRAETRELVGGGGGSADLGGGVLAAGAAALGCLAFLGPLAVALGFLGFGAASDSDFVCSPGSLGVMVSPLVREGAERLGRLSATLTTRVWPVNGFSRPGRRLGAVALVGCRHGGADAAAHEKIPHDGHPTRPDDLHEVIEDAVRHGFVERPHIAIRP